MKCKGKSRPENEKIPCSSSTVPGGRGLALDRKPSTSLAGVIANTNLVGVRELVVCFKNAVRNNYMN